MGKYYEWVQQVAKDYFANNPDMIDNPNATAVRACMPPAPAEDSNDTDMSGRSCQASSSGNSDLLGETDKSHCDCGTKGVLSTAEGQE